MNDDPTQPQISPASHSGDNAGPSPRYDKPQIEGYQIVGDRPLAEPSMGAVWKAVQLSTKREVALKLISPAFLGADRIRTRFEREVELAATLEHPNIARVYDSGIRQGVYCYAMEFIPGQHLNAYVIENHLNQQQILALMEKVCRAIQHAHQRGIIHADLKPSNVLATPDGEPHVLDFGLAKLQGEISLVVSRQGGVIAGTPPFMSPEQAAGRRDTLDIRSDVYTLGVILYELLMGRSPYGEVNDVHELLRRIREGEIHRPRVISKTIDRELEALLLKATALATTERYKSAGELAQDITNYLRSDVLIARKPTTAYLIRKRLRKHRRPVAVGSAVIVAFLGVAAFSYIRIFQAQSTATQATNEAERQRRRAEQNEAEVKRLVELASHGQQEADAATARETAARLERVRPR